jgi:hypothetical protein
MGMSEKRERRRDKSNETDLTVVVGSDCQTKEFQCHAAILSFASSKLDTMIHTSNGRLLLPQFIPEAWELFYKCIDPRNNGFELCGGMMEGVKVSKIQRCSCHFFESFR